MSEFKLLFSDYHPGPFLVLSLCFTCSQCGRFPLTNHHCSCGSQGSLFRPRGIAGGARNERNGPPATARVTMRTETYFATRVMIDVGFPNSILLTGVYHDLYERESCYRPQRPHGQEEGGSGAHTAANSATRSTSRDRRLKRAAIDNTVLSCPTPQCPAHDELSLLRAMGSRA